MRRTIRQALAPYTATSVPRSLIEAYYGNARPMPSEAEKAAKRAKRVYEPWPNQIDWLSDTEM